MSGEHDAIKAGISNSWDFWLSQHDVSVPDTIHASVKEAVSEWLDRHGEALIKDALTEAVRSHLEVDH